MAITILAPAPAAAVTLNHVDGSDDDSDTGGVDLQGDIDMRPAKRARHSDIVTPGEIITDDAQWMRYVSLPLSNFKSNKRIEATVHISRLPAQKS